MIEEKYDIFRDPIHGFIKVNPVEKDIINSLPFQRLRQIRQLGLTNFLYHGAEHTRFGHSLGVMNFAERVYESITARYKPVFNERFGWNADDYSTNCEKLRLAALLHDIGHAPFSHASEELFHKEGGKKEDHERYSVKIVQETEIGKIINGYKRKTGVSCQDVVDLLEKKPLGVNILLRSFLSSQIDVDRMDYLLRDSLFSGVQYGRYDSDRLIEKVGLVENKDGNIEIGVEESGLHAAEGLLLARYLMFTQVYFHPTRRIYDIHLTDVIKNALQERGFGGEYPLDVKTYLTIDDSDVFVFIKQKIAENRLESAKLIANRDHYILAKQTSEHTHGAEMKQFETSIEALKTKYGGENVIKDESLNAPYNYDYQKGEEKLLIKIESKPPKDIAILSEIIGHLSEIFQMRAYLHPKFYNKGVLKK